MRTGRVNLVVASISLNTAGTDKDMMLLLFELWLVPRHPDHREFRSDHLFKTLRATCWTVMKYVEVSIQSWKSTVIECHGLVGGQESIPPR